MAGHSEVRLSFSTFVVEVRFSIELNKISQYMQVFQCQIINYVLPLQRLYIIYIILVAVRDL